MPIESHLLMDGALHVYRRENSRYWQCSTYLSSPSITERIHKLEDAGAIRGYTIVVDPKAFGLGIAAHVRIRAMPGEVRRLAQMLVDTPEVVEADRVTGEDCFLVKVVVSDVQELETVIDRFQPYSATDTAIIHSTTVVRRLPKL